MHVNSDDLGIVNTKPGRDNAECAVIDVNARTYAFSDLFIEYGQLVSGAARVDRQRTTVTTEDHEDLPHWVNEYLKYGQRTYRNNALFKVACRMKDAGYTQLQCEQLAGERAAADGLEQWEINRTIDSAYRNTGGRALNLAERSMAAGDAVQRALRGRG